MTYSRAGALDTAARSGSADSGDGRSSHVESWSERLYAALPLFVVGGLCLAVALVLYTEGAVTSLGGSQAAHLQPWILFVALAITSLAGGTVALFAEEPRVEELPASAPVVVPPIPRDREWDESLIEPEEKPFRPAYRALDNDELMQGPIAEAVPPDMFLHQLDELEVSLKKKLPPPAKDSRKK